MCMCGHVVLAMFTLHLVLWAKSCVNIQHLSSSVKKYLRSNLGKWEQQKGGDVAASKPQKHSQGCGQERLVCCSKAREVNAQPVMQEQGRCSMSGNIQVAQIQSG